MSERNSLDVVLCKLLQVFLLEQGLVLDYFQRSLLTSATL